MALTKVKPSQVEGTSPTLTGTEVLTNKDLTSGTNTFPSSLQPTLVSGSTIKTINGVNVLGSGDIVTPDLVGFRNRIINGDMRVDQRNLGAVVTLTTGTGGYAVDRFYTNNTTPVTATTQQLADGPTLAGTFGGIQKKIEGYNAVDLGFGQTGARSVTVSFWVKATVTGTYVFTLSNSASTRFYNAEYTISASNTWEKKTITIAGDTTGTWLYTNGIGITCTFVYVSGSTYNVGSNGSWSATASAFSTSNQVSAMASTSHTFRITGVQFEVGTVATTFEFRPIGAEFAMCQRYYQKSLGDSAIITYNSAALTSNYVYATITLPVVMRATPTLTVYQGSTDGQVVSLVNVASFAGTAMAPYSSGADAATVTVTLYGTSTYGVRCGYKLLAEL